MSAVFLAVVLAAAPAAAPSEYVVASTHATPAALMKGSDEAWRAATKVEWGPSPYETDFRASWTPDALFLRFDARDAHPWHTMTKRDEHLSSPQCWLHAPRFCLSYSEADR